jgi:hypothetical protein
LTALQMAFENAITAAAQGGTVATAAKIEARDTRCPPCARPPPMCRRSRRC